MYSINDETDYKRIRDPIVHRNISEENIFLAEDGEIVVGGFGTTAALRKQLLGNAPVGKPQLRAPETFYGNECLEISQDVYSAGMLMYWLFAGKHACPDGLSLYGTLHWHQHKPGFQSDKITAYENVLLWMICQSASTRFHNFARVDRAIDEAVSQHEIELVDLQNLYASLT